jgi:hypothetical protein
MAGMKNLIKTAFSKAKDFVKKEYKKIKQNATKVLSDIKRRSKNAKTRETFKPGALVAFNYDAKYKQQRYDRNPLIICLGWSKEFPKTHFYGLNLHWVDMNQRVSIASFFIELLNKRNGKLVYDDVKPFLKKFKKHPILRMYIYKNVSNRVYVMDQDMYLSAAAIPSEKWMGGK